MSQPPVPQYRPGDVVNGHVLTPQGQWVPAQAPPGQMPQGQMPQGQMPQGQYPQGQYPQGQYPLGAPPAGYGAPLVAPPVQKPKKPIWKRWWFIVLAAIVIIVVLTNLGGGGGDKDETDDPAPAASDTEDEDVTEPEPEEPAAEEPAVNPYEESYGTFEPVIVTGTGDMVIAVPAPTGVVTASHDGSGNFAISGLDAANQPTGDLPVNTIGVYAGTTAFGLSSFSDAVTLQITADGNWSLTISPVAAAPALALPATGGGDAVFLYDGEAGTWAITHAGSRNFSVLEYGGVFPNLMVNEIGAYTGTVPAQAGPAVIVISADGGWTITPQ